MSVFAYHGWCADPDCREAATKRAQIGIGNRTLVVPLCDEHLETLKKEFDDMRGHDLAMVEGAA